MASPSTPNPFTAVPKGDPEHMMKLLIALHRALDISSNGSPNKSADAHESRRR